MSRRFPANSRISRSIGFRVERRTTLIKWVTIIGLNLFGLIIAVLVSPPPSPWEAAITAITAPFSGGLHVIGNMIGAFLNAILKWDVLGYLLLANAAAAIPLLFGAQFVKQLYQFSAYSLALGYLVDAFLVPAFYYLDIQPGRDAPHPDYRRGMGGPRVALAQDNKLVPAKKDPRNRSIARAGGPGMVVLPPEYAAQLERDGRLGYVVGPGVVRLGRFEKVYKLINLRQIIRKKTATALTRDGIPVTVEVTIQARIQASDLPSKKSPYPFRDDAIRKLIISTPTRTSGPVPWEERPTLLANSVLNEVLAKYRLDELFDPLDNDLQTPRPTIHNEIRRALRQRARGFGVEITEVWLGEFQLPAEVTKQYLAYWQTDWQRQDRTSQAAGQVSSIQALSRARAQAQQFIIETLVDAFRVAQEADLGITPRHLAALRLIDSLEQIYRQIDPIEKDQGRQMLALEQHLARLRNTIQTSEQQLEDLEPDAKS